MVKEEAEQRQREIDEFNKKVVVESKVFKVNTIVSESNNVDKYSEIRQDPVKKVGLRLSSKKLKHLVKRQLQSVSKEAPASPISAFSFEPFSQTPQKPTSGLLPNITMTPRLKDGTHEQKNFKLYTRADVLAKLATGSNF